MIGNNSYVHIGGWMINELGLGGTELLVYAVIYSFTNGTDDHCFHGSANYLGEWCGLKRRQMMNVLKSLEEKELIYRKEDFINGVKFVSYYTGCANIAQGDEQLLHEGGCANIAHNNNRAIDKEREDNNSIHSPESENLYLMMSESSYLNNIGKFAEIEHPQAPVEELNFYMKEDPYVQSMMRNKNFNKNNQDAIMKLSKLGYNWDTLKIVCAFIKQDDFWSKQIRSLSKLLKKNPDGVMYIDVMIDKIKQWKPRNNFIPTF